MKKLISLIYLLSITILFSGCCHWICLPEHHHIEHHLPLPK